MSGFVLRLLASLGVSLLLTLLLELAFALACGKRGRALLFVMLANVVTNPPVVLLALLARRFSPLYAAAVEAVLEVAAVCVEALIYRANAPSVRRPLVFSLGANILSCGVGVIISVLT